MTAKPHPILAYIHQKRGAFAAAVPKTLAAAMTLESIVQGLGLALAESKGGKLGRCRPDDVYNMVLRATRLGLDITPGTQEAHLVPFYNTDKKKMECQLMIGRYGDAKLALRTGEYAAIVVSTVYENDEWDLDEASLHLIHRSSPGERGRPLFAYARAWLKGQDRSFPSFMEILWWPEFEKIRDAASKRSGGRLSPAYKQWPEQMAQRSVFRRMLKFAPKSAEHSRVLAQEIGLYQGPASVKAEYVPEPIAIAETPPDFATMEPGDVFNFQGAETPEPVPVEVEQPIGDTEEFGGSDYEEIP